MKAAILGFGTVGRGLVRLWKEDGAAFAEQMGAPVELGPILVRQLARDRGGDERGFLLTDQVRDILEDPSIDLVFEVMSDKDRGLEYNLALLSAGKHVVTANKAALAQDFFGLQERAKEAGVHIRFEAAVGGGVPLIAPLDRIRRFHFIPSLEGILNSTTNFILTERARGLSSQEVLSRASRLGTLEEDPANDLEGRDARRKLAILSSMILEQDLNEEEIPTVGISLLEDKDFDWAKERGRSLKLRVSLTQDRETFSLSVLPTALDDQGALARTWGLMNQVRLEADRLGVLYFHGQGGGMFPTAHAMWTDAYELSRSQAAYVRRGSRRKEDLSWHRRALFYLRAPSDEKGRLESLTLKEALACHRTGQVVIEIEGGAL